MTSTFKELKRRSLPDQIVEQIIDIIDKGKLKVGDKLPTEPALMKMFGVGRSTIREAIGALSMTGVLTVKQGSGTYVTAFPNSHIQFPLKMDALRKSDKAKELIEARIGLEQTIVSMAAERATKNDLDNLRKVLKKLEVARKNRKKFIQSDLSFHLALARVSRNSILLKFYEEIHYFIRTWQELASRIEPNRLAESLKEHQEIFEAVERHDSEKARQTMDKHLRRIYDGLSVQNKGTTS